MSAWTLAGFGANAAMILMAVGWAIARRMQNASCLEVAWSYGFAVVVWVYALIGPGDPLRKWLITGMATIWSLRLGTSLLLDVVRHHPAEGRRYVALREQFPKRPWLMFFGFSQYQAALLALLSAPFAIACSHAAPGINGWEVAGLVLWLVAIVGQAAASFQSRRLRASRENHGNVSDARLQPSSRHPDRFFDGLVWVAYFIFSVGSPWGWITFYCPLLMFHFLTQATGILPAFPGPEPGHQPSETRVSKAGDA